MTAVMLAVGTAIGLAVVAAAGRLDGAGPAREPATSAVVGFLIMLVLSHPARTRVRAELEVRDRLAEDTPVTRPAPPLMSIAWRTLAVAAAVAFSPLVFGDSWLTGCAILVGIMGGNLVGEVLLPLRALTRGERARERRIYRVVDADDDPVGYAWAPAALAP